MFKPAFSTGILAIVAITAFSIASAQQPTPGQPARPNTPIAGSQFNQAARQQANGPTVTEAIAKKLQKANEAEIELATMAGKKTKNDDLKNLTAMLVKDHQALSQELQKYCDMNAASAQRGQNQSAANQLGNQTPGGAQTQTRLIDSQSARVPQELCDVAEQACDNSLKMAKEMLSKQEGRDFELAFLAHQCFAHSQMLAELNAIESEGPQELRPIAQKAGQTIEQHLEKAQQLVMKMRDDSDDDSENSSE